MARTPEAARLLGQYAVRVWETKKLRKLEKLEKLEKLMSADEQDFITNALRVCQDIQNRFYSERIKLGDIDPEERLWLSKVSLLAQDAQVFLENRSVDRS